MYWVLKACLTRSSQFHTNSSVEHDEENRPRLAEREYYESKEKENEDTEDSNNDEQKKGEVKDK